MVYSIVLMHFHAEQKKRYALANENSFLSLSLFSFAIMYGHEPSYIFLLDATKKPYLPGIAFFYLFIRASRSLRSFHKRPNNSTHYFWFFDSVVWIFIFGRFVGFVCVFVVLVFRSIEDAHNFFWRAVFWYQRQQNPPDGKKNKQTAQIEFGWMVFNCQKYIKNDRPLITLAE